MMKGFALSKLKTSQMSNGFLQNEKGDGESERLQIT